MATTIINPSPNNNSTNNNNLFFLFGLITLLILGIIFVIYGLPLLSNMNFGDTNKIKIEVPERIDVKVEQK